MAYIIGIGHRSENGKDTLANYMVNHLSNMLPGKTVIKLSWAWKLKDICHQLYGHLGLKEGNYYESDEGRKYRNIKIPNINLTPVEIWIKMGTYAVRDQIWDLTWVEYNKASCVADIMISADTRFPIEIGYCDVTILCHNPRVPNREGETVDNRLSSFHDWMYTIINDGSKSDLQHKAYMLCRQLSRKF